jgi:Outer membrane protein beta-barrel domain
MMRISFLIILFLIFHTLSAQEIVSKTEQKPFFFGLHFSPDYSYRQLVNNDGQSVTQTIVRARDRIEKARMGFTTGVSFGWNISSNLQIESGLFYSAKGYKTNKELLVYIPPASSDDPIAVKNVYRKQFLDVPLRIVYQWGGKRLQVAPSGGMVLNLFLHQGLITYSYYETGEVKKGKAKLQDDIRKLNLSVQLGMGLRYRLNDRLKLMVEPVLRYGLLNSADTPVAEKLWTAGLNTGVYFSFNQ